MSVVLGSISIISLGIVVYLSYRADGAAENGYGVTGLLATLFSFVGLILGVITVRHKNYYRAFPWLGLILNFLSLAAIALILYMGSML